MLIQEKNEHNKTPKIMAAHMEFSTVKHQNGFQIPYFLEFYQCSGISASGRMHH